MFQQYGMGQQGGMAPQQYGGYGGPQQQMMSQGGMGGGGQAGNQQMIQPQQQSGGAPMFSQQHSAAAAFNAQRPGQGDYRQMGGPQAPPPRAPYMQQAPNVTMNANMAAQMGAMGGQGGPAPPYSRTGAQGKLSLVKLDKSLTKLFQECNQVCRTSSSNNSNASDSK